jgi:acid phosphatase type 7
LGNDKAATALEELMMKTDARFMPRAVTLMVVMSVCPLGDAAPPWVTAANYTQVFDVPTDTAAFRSWMLHPVYALPGRAGTQPGPAPLSLRPADFEPFTEPRVFQGLQPTQRIAMLRNRDELPGGPLSVEMWVNDHVSQEIAVALAARSADSRQVAGWGLTYWSQGYSNRSIQFVLSDDAGEAVVLRYANREKDGFKEYWRHVVGVFDGTSARLYVNGSQRGSKSLSGVNRVPPDAFLEIAGYFEHEPYMELGNIVRRVRLHDRALSEQEIGERFAALCAEVEAGVVFPGTLHFNAGPLISFVSETTAAITFETDRPVSARVAWGTETPLANSAPVTEGDLIREHTFESLQPDTPYFYEVTATDAAGNRVSSGLLSFRTATPAGRPFRFAIIGDTETRPHINQQLCRLLWDERVSFVVNLGDLTDGGQEHDKFQWNYEYFVGMLPLGSRVPVMPVPGNGEGDLYWYKRYHALPGDKSPYAFTWGDAAFFMLDSNPRRDEFVPGGRQHAWLTSALSACEARWKFVCLHHAPYTSEENDYGDSWAAVSTLGDPAVRPLIPLLERHGVDVVMFGHLHLYERMRPMLQGQVHPQGIMYLLSGGGGGNLEDFAPNPAPFTVRTHRGHHYCTLDVSHDRCVLRMYDLQGAMRDQHELTKP